MLSKREKMIVVVLSLVLVALVADRSILTPLMGKLNQWATQSQDLQAEIDAANSLFKRRALLERQWRDAGGEDLTMSVESESRVLYALDRWSKDAGLTLTSVKPSGSTPVKDPLYEMKFAVAGTGTLHAAAEFMWQIERAPLPLRIREMQLGSANEAGTEMSLTLNISMLTMVQKKKTGGKNAS